MGIFLLEQEEMPANVIPLHFIIHCRMRMGFQRCWCFNLMFLCPN